MTTSAPALCEMTSRSTGQPCQQPERWLMSAPSYPAPAEARVCQVHGKQLEREGWTFVRELHPVAGYERLGLSAEIEGRKG